ncbi:2Fe-2S iron-sulfur cluster-binding protein [Streptomyces hirsutus]|uniref:2Fe-2S iron-sulfur cluster-binding protein n=1 Tax=Streptomyces hirsutus TaxID=35620 RepID=UPI0006E4051B|nr:2Fe-2S iron-sulfur cluster-binding protein [Streptomyces hirsutus]
MAEVTWITAGGERITAEVGDGVNLMEAAVANRVPGIVGECGGGMMCATCHVYVESDHRTGEPGPIEADLLDFADAPRRDGSRLSCQISARPELDGITVEVPPAW